MIILKLINIYQIGLERTWLTFHHSWSEPTQRKESILPLFHHWEEEDQEEPREKMPRELRRKNERINFDLKKKNKTKYQNKTTILYHSHSLFFFYNFIYSSFTKC